MRKLPPLNALRFFDSAARHSSFSLAAKDLCVTHSAVSQQIRLLEDWIGCPLFDRHSGGVHMTSAGSRLQGAAQGAFDLLEHCCNDLRQSTQLTELVIGAPASVLSNWLIPRLEDFEALHPEVRVKLQTAAEHTMLNTQRVDALILASHAWPTEWNITPLFPETIGPVCSPLWSDRIQDPTAILAEPLLHTTSRPDAWREWMTHQDILLEPKYPVREFDHLGHMLEAAAAGLGIAIAPAVLVEAELRRSRLVAPLGFIDSGATFSLCIRNTVSSSKPALELLRNWLTKQTWNATSHEE